MAYTMQINGRGKMHPVDDYADASALMLEQQVRVGYRGPSDRSVYPRNAVIFENGVAVAHVSQNGRVWAGTEYTAGAEPLCEAVR